MIITKIKDRGTLFTFEDDTSVYLINTNKRLFLCDTHLGPESMDVIKKYITEQGLSSKELVIFNSHSDWDHIWGNCSFNNSLIIAHTSCTDRMIERAQYDLDVIPKEYQKGNVKIKLPNLTFERKLIFEDDEIEFIYAPGHTICSSICFDKRDSTLYSGDLIENPIPFILHDNLLEFKNSLELIRSINPKTIVTAHSGIANKSLLESNIVYIENIIYKSVINFDNIDVKQIHESNIKRILILKYEKLIKHKLVKDFNYKEYKQNFWRFMNISEEFLLKESINIRNTNYNDLEKGLSDFLIQING